MSQVVVMIISNRTQWDAEFGYSLASLLFNDRKTNLICDVGRTSGQTIAEMRNRAIECAKSRKATHLLMLDDDQVYPPDMIARLLKHEKDVVCGIYPARRAPWYLNVHKFAPSPAENGGGQRYHSHRIYHLPTDKIMPVDVMGLGGALFDLRIFDRLEKPYFDSPQRDDEVGIIGDEFYFAENCRAAGVELWVDPTLRYVHMCPNGVVYNPEKGVEFVMPRQ